ncbi:Tol-Pal system protein TolB, partial [Pseudoalteromonas sp. SIMBA_153]
VTGSIFSPAWSPDGNRIAYSIQREKSYPIIYVQNVSGGSATTLTPFSGSNLSPSFSPDGSKILFSSSFEGSADIYE